MRLISCMGMIFRVTERNYIKLLKSIVSDGNDTIDKVGVSLGYAQNITDMTPEDAFSLLEEIKEQKCKKKRG